jgi:hypothetical protein
VGCGTALSNAARVLAATPGKAFPKEFYEAAGFYRGFSQRFISLDSAKPLREYFSRFLASASISAVM